MDFYAHTISKVNGVVSYEVKYKVGNGNMVLISNEVLDLGSYFNDPSLNYVIDTESSLELDNISPFLLGVLYTELSVRGTAKDMSLEVKGSIPELSRSYPTDSDSKKRRQILSVGKSPVATSLVLFGVTKYKINHPNDPSAIALVLKGSFQPGGPTYTFTDISNGTLTPFMMGANQKHFTIPVTKNLSIQV